MCRRRRRVGVSVELHAHNRIRVAHQNRNLMPISQRPDLKQQAMSGMHTHPARAPRQRHLHKPVLTAGSSKRRTRVDA